MNVATIVAIAQRTYRAYYETCIETCRHRQDFVLELLILVNGPAGVPEKHRLWRCDAIWKQDGKPQPGQFELDPPEPFSAVTERLASGITITLHPIVWHRCEFYFAVRELPWDALDRWHTKWLDEKDKKPRDKFGLAGVIHWWSQPNREGDQCDFVVDFGSAPAEAFPELISALAEVGVEQVTVGSFGPTGE
jgi:hypothetical protein